MTPTDDNKWNDQLFQEDLGALYEKSYDRVVKLVYRTTGNKDDAEDVVQTVFQRLIERPEPPKGFRKNPEGYVYRAAINEMLNLINARKRHGLEDEDVGMFELAEPQLDPIREHKILRVRAVLAKMNPEHAELLNLYYVDELSCSEIGRLRGRLPNAIFLQLFRARAEFKKQYRIQEKNDEAQKTRNERLDRTGFSEASEA